MNDFKSLQKLSEGMNRYYKSIQPASLQFEKAFEKNQKYILKIMQPYAEKGTEDTS
jgi:hypothetical protein